MMLRVVCRDLKSGNVLVSHALRAKITDFGSIRQRLQWHGRGSTNKSSASSFGASNGGGGYGSGEDDDDDDMFELPDIRYSWANGNKTMHLSMTAGVGTPMYMAPEALYGRSYDQKADVFSFGVLLWEIATQQHPDIIQQEYGASFDGPLFPTLLKLLRDDNKRLRFPESMCGWAFAWPLSTNACARTRTHTHTVVGVFNFFRSRLCDAGTPDHPIPSWFKALTSSCMDSDPDARPTFATLQQQLS